MIESEKKLEKLLAEETRHAGGWSLKLPAIHVAGLPDRVCLFPGGRLFFAEMKTTGKKPTKIQKVIHGKLRKLGFTVVVLDNTKDIKLLIKKYERS